MTKLISVSLYLLLVEYLKKMSLESINYFALETTKGLDVSYH